jgi:hypothetical protein
MPETVEGTVTIEWPPGKPLRAAQPGWGIVIRTEIGEQVSTVSRITVHAAADSIVWAELEMFTDADGKPVYGGVASVVKRMHTGDDGEPVTAVFPFIVAGMSVRGTAGVAAQ